MATHANRLPMTHVSLRRSSFRTDNANFEELDIKDEIGYQVRREDELSKVEQLCLHTLNDNPATKKFMKLDFASLFKGLKVQLVMWPYFFRSKEESGIEMQQGFVTLWSNFLIAETLMASISIQPLVTMPDIAHGWKFKLYGYIWMISVISDFGGILVTALFLGFLLGCPNKIAWNWMCEIGWLRNIPSMFVLLDGSLTLAAIAYTSWILYGYQVGIVGVVLVLCFVVISFKLAIVLSKERQCFRYEHAV